MKKNSYYSFSSDTTCKKKLKFLFWAWLKHTITFTVFTATLLNYGNFKVPPRQVYRQIIPHEYIQALQQYQPQQTQSPTTAPTIAGQTVSPTMPPYPVFPFDPEDTEPLMEKAKRFDMIIGRLVTDEERLKALPFIRRRLQSKKQQYTSHANFSAQIFVTLA